MGIFNFNEKQIWERLSTFKPVNAVTRLVLNSGKSSPTNMELTQLVPTMAILTFNWKESMSTITKPLVVNTFHVPFWSIWSQELWTLSDLVHLVKSSVQTTLSSVSLVLVTTGLKVTTPKKLNPAIASRDSNSLTLSVVVLVPVWVHFLSQKS